MLFGQTLTKRYEFTKVQMSNLINLNFTLSVLSYIRKQFDIRTNELSGF